MAGPGPTSQPQCGPVAHQSLSEFGAVSGALPRDSTHRSISLSACYLCMYACIHVCMYVSISHLPIYFERKRGFHIVSWSQT